MSRYFARRPERLAGPEGLLAAVIHRAAYDALKERGKWRGSAWAYFAGPAYSEHLSFLGLPPSYLPEAIEEAAKDATKEGT